jgi:hypothetical protein
MDQLHETLDKLLTESDHLRVLTEWDEGEEPVLAQVRIALSVAKRVRRESNLVVRQLAALRDELQPQEAQAQ